MTHHASRLTDAVGLLYPTRCGDEDLVDPAASTLVPVPSTRSARLLVPGRHPSAAAAAVRRYSQALSWRDRTVRTGGALALRLGAARLSSSAVMVDDGPDSDNVTTRLSALLGQDVVVAMGVGSLRANAKPVLQVFRPDGRSLAFVKVGHNGVTAQLVRAEAAALAEVGARAWQHLRAPAVLHLDHWHDLELLVMTALPTPVLPGARRTSLPTSAMDELSAAWGASPLPLRTTSWWRRTLQRADGLADARARDRLHAALGAAEGRWGDHPLALGAWHGDWAPWNMAWRRGVVQLWDWERFEVDVPVGLDRVHYVVQTRLRRSGMSDDVLDAALHDVGERPGAADLEAQLLRTCYLAEISARYLTGAEGEGGEAVKATADVVLTALERVASGGKDTA